MFLFFANIWTRKIEAREKMHTTKFKNIFSKKILLLILLGRENVFIEQFFKRLILAELLLKLGSMNSMQPIS